MSFFVISLLSVTTLSVVAGSTEEAREIFNKGNSLYLSQNYEEARKCYEAVLRMGYDDPSVYFNLANTYLSLNMPGPAALNLYLANRLEPRGEDILKNISIIGGGITKRADADEVKSAHKANGDLISFKRFLVSFDFMSKNEIAVSVFLLYLFFLIFSLIRKLLRRKVTKFFVGVSAAVTFAFFVVFIVVFVGRLYYENVYPPSIVMQSAELKVAPSESDSYNNGIKVDEGTLVELLRTYGNYGEVFVSEINETGWVDIKSIKKI